MTVERQVRTQTHGRYLLRPPQRAGRAPLLVGFHGYGENADIQLDRLKAIRGSEGWCLLSIQGLHRFYSRTNDVVASWMTRQGRDSAIADNLAYVATTLAAVSTELETCSPFVFVGFSQGVAMAFRAATRIPEHPSSVIAVGGDVPPELDQETLGRTSAVLICRGALDRFYSAEQYAQDVGRLAASGIRVRRCEFDGGHEWSPLVADAAASFLEEPEFSSDCHHRG